MTVVYVAVKEFAMDEKVLYAGISLDEAFNEILNAEEEWLEHSRVDIWKDGKRTSRYCWSFELNKFMLYKKDKDQFKMEQYTIVEDSSKPLQDGDSLRRRSDGKLFTYSGNEDLTHEAYGRVYEMAVPVYLPDFGRVEE